MKKLFLFLLTFIASVSFAQTVRITNNVSEATYNVFVTNNLSDADIIVYITPNISESCFDKGIWCISSIRYPKEVVIYFTHNRSLSDIKIFITNNKSQARWQKTSFQVK